MSQDRPRCEGLTQKGVQCRRPALMGGTTCRTHVEQSKKNNPFIDFLDNYIFVGVFIKYIKETFIILDNILLKNKITLFIFIPILLSIYGILYEYFYFQNMGINFFEYADIDDFVIFVLIQPYLIFSSIKPAIYLIIGYFIFAIGSHYIAGTVFYINKTPLGASVINNTNERILLFINYVKNRFYNNNAMVFLIVNYLLLPIYSLYLILYLLYIFIHTINNILLLFEKIIVILNEREAMKTIVFSIIIIVVYLSISNIRNIAKTDYLSANNLSNSDQADTFYNKLKNFDKKATKAAQDTFGITPLKRSFSTVFVFEKSQSNYRLIQRDNNGVNDTAAPKKCAPKYRIIESSSRYLFVRGINNENKVTGPITIIPTNNISKIEHVPENRAEHPNYCEEPRKITDRESRNVYISYAGNNPEAGAETVRVPSSFIENQKNKDKNVLLALTAIQKTLSEHHKTNTADAPLPWKDDWSKIRDNLNTVTVKLGKTLSDIHNNSVPRSTYTAGTRPINCIDKSPLDSIFFKTNEANLSNASKRTLKNVALEISKNTIRERGDWIILEAHADRRGSLLKNDKLTEDRALAVRNFLVKELASNPKWAQWIRVTPYGKRRYLPDGEHGSDQRGVNTLLRSDRRVDIVDCAESLTAKSDESIDKANQ